MNTKSKPETDDPDFEQAAYVITDADDKVVASHGSFGPRPLVELSPSVDSDGPKSALGGSDAGSNHPNAGHILDDRMAGVAARAADRGVSRFISPAVAEKYAAAEITEPGHKGPGIEL